MNISKQAYRNNALIGLLAILTLLLSFWVIRVVLNLPSVFESIEATNPPAKSKYPWIFMSWLWIYIPSFLLPLLFAHNLIQLFIPEKEQFSRQLFLGTIQAASILGVIGTLTALTMGVYRNSGPILAVMHPIRYVNYLAYHLMLTSLVGAFGLACYWHRSLPRSLCWWAIIGSGLGYLLFIRGASREEGQALYLVSLIVINGAFVTVMSAYQALLWQSYWEEKTYTGS